MKEKILHRGVWQSQAYGKRWSRAGAGIFWHCVHAGQRHQDEPTSGSSKWAFSAFPVSSQCTICLMCQSKLLFCSWAWHFKEHRRTRVFPVEANWDVPGGCHGERGIRVPQRSSPWGVLWRASSAHPWMRAPGKAVSSPPGIPAENSKLRGS